MSLHYVGKLARNFLRETITLYEHKPDEDFDKIFYRGTV